MARVKLTAGRVRDYACAEGAAQSFLWDTDAPGLGVRATANGAKSYIFQGKLNGKSIRITIGDVKAWGIEAGSHEFPGARERARQLQTMLDQNIDPRDVKADAIAAKKAQAVALVKQESRESVMVATAWEEYLKARKPFWGDRHYADHVEVMQAGGAKRGKSKKLTQPGVLASMATVRLVDMTPERVTEWAKVESEKRPGRARIAYRLLKAFLSWCAEHPAYREIITVNAAKNKAAREQLGKPKALEDVLQREQLKAWFAAVKQIGNPVTSAYYQTLLLTGARPNELTALRWEDVDFQWNSMTIRDKVEGLRVIPLTPYVAHLLAALPRRKLTVRQIDVKEKNTKQDEPNVFVFSSPTSSSGHLEGISDAHNKACVIAGVSVTLYGLRRSFATLCEWIEMPAGIAAQIQGHKPSGVREKHYIRRPLDLLRVWHVNIEAWILEQAEVKFVPKQAGLQLVPSAS